MTASWSKKGKVVWGLFAVVLLFTSVFAALAAPDFESAELSASGVPEAPTRIPRTVDRAHSSVIAPAPSVSYATATISEASEFVPGEVIVKFKQHVRFTITQQSDGIVTTGIRSLDALNTRYNVMEQTNVFESAEKYVSAEIPDLTTIYVLTFPQDADILSIITEYQKDRNVEYAEPNYIRKASAIPNDPVYPGQWAHQLMWSEQAWNITRGNNDVVIAIIDTGVDWNHPDLAANIWTNQGELPVNGIDDDGNGFIDDIRGWDFVDTDDLSCDDVDCSDRDNDPMDFDGHGTHCAGIAGAVTDNGIGVAGMAWNCSIMTVRAGYRAGTTAYLEDLDIAAAIVYATDNGADVISMSFYAPAVSNVLQDAITYATANGLEYELGDASTNGIVFVAAAGNDNSDSITYPAGYDDVIAVAATNQSDGKTDFTSYGSWVDVAAPGFDILSTYFDDAYEVLCGTSMSTPYVAGLAGLILSKNPSFTPDEVTSILHSTTDPVTASEYIGIGRINAYKALQINSIPIATLDPSLDDAKVRGSIGIIGTAAGAHFQNYTVEYGVGIYPTSWTAITASTTPVINDTLATWYAIPGTVSIRLRVTDTFGTTSEDRVVIHASSGSAVSYVPDNFTTIREAVVAAWDGDTIIVRDGTYTENVDVTVNNLTIRSENGSALCLVQAANANDHVFEVTADNVVIRGFTTKNAKYPKAGVYLSGAKYGEVADNTVSGNYHGIYLSSSCYNNSLTNNTVQNNYYGIRLYSSSNNNLTNNTVNSNIYDGIKLSYSSNNNLMGNTASNNDDGIGLGYSSNYNILTDNIVTNNDDGIGLYASSNYNILTGNTATSNTNCGIYRSSSNNNRIYNNYFNNTNNARDDGTNVWNITQTEGRNILGGPYLGGNYWSDYNGTDADGDGLGDTPYDIPGGTNKDYHPLVTIVAQHLFDTGKGDYPSLAGLHTGTIKLTQTVTVSTLYTYPCNGTGGHTEYVKLWRGSEVIAEKTWNGYVGDWYNRSFDTSFTIYAGMTYNYTIRTSSYPQIIHNSTLLTDNGWITCTGFTDANGRRYDNWIPAIRLWADQGGER
ncbi:MAG: S8 family serine peptidase [Methanomicrobia archaeon]|nr:S8 family serine peptidase [Methanomicrobia archaeon]